MSPWRVILATMVIFGCGVVTGGLLMKTVIPAATSSTEVVHITTNAAPPLGQWQRPEFIRRMDKQLDLTPAQREQVVQILHDSQIRSRALWDEIDPQLRDEFRRVRAEIRQALTTDQKKKWDELLRSKSRKPDNQAVRPPTRDLTPANAATNNP